MVVARHAWRAKQSGYRHFVEARRGAPKEFGGAAVMGGDQAVQSCDPAVQSCDPAVHCRS